MTMIRHMKMMHMRIHAQTMVHLHPRMTMTQAQTMIHPGRRMTMIHGSIGRHEEGTLCRTEGWTHI